MFLLVQNRPVKIDFAKEIEKKNVCKFSDFCLKTQNLKKFLKAILLEKTFVFLFYLLFKMIDLRRGCGET